MDEKDKRIASLEQAIRDANSWIEAGEGVSLLYYADDMYHDDISKQLVKEVIGG